MEPCSAETNRRVDGIAFEQVRKYTTNIPI